MVGIGCCGRSYQHKCNPGMENKGGRVGPESLPGEVCGGEWGIDRPECGGLEIEVEGTCCLGLPSALGHDGWQWGMSKG